MSEWWRGAVLYQIYPRSFLDTNGDGIGDLPGIIERLDYVADLGVDGIWISPFFKSPQRDFGYDVSDYHDVDPLFGTLDDFDQLVERAQGQGLKVIIDQVYSHTSDKHEWFDTSRQDRTNEKADWYVWADPKPDGSPPNNWQSVFTGSAWTWDSRRHQYFFHNFLDSQPDLNLHNPHVQDALLDVARFWLSRGVDGFRLDAINFAMHDPELRDNPPYDLKRPSARTFDYQIHQYNQSHPDIPRFLERLRAVTDAYDDRFTLAEIGGIDRFGEMHTFTEGNTRLNAAYSFDYLYANRISTRHIARAANKWTSEPSAGWPSWAFSNHDAPRCISRWHDGSDPETYSKLMALLLLTLRGNAVIYQGEELGLPQADVPFERLQDPEAIANWPRTLGRDGARTPMPWDSSHSFAGFSSVEPWLPVDDRHLPLAASDQITSKKSVYSFYRELLRIRSEFSVLRCGDIEFLDAPDGIFAFKRRLEDVEHLVVGNLEGQPLNWRPHDFEGEILLSVQDIDDPCGLPEHIAPYSGYIANVTS